MFRDFHLQRLGNGLALEQQIVRQIQCLLQDEPDKCIVAIPWYHAPPITHHPPLVVFLTQQTDVIRVVWFKAGTEGFEKHGQTEKRPGNRYK